VKPKPQIIDSHCHFYDDFYDKLNMNVDEAMEEAESEGVVCVLNVCTRIKLFHKIHHISKSHPRIFSSVGNHPLNVHLEGGIAKTSEILQLLKNDKVISIGEVGLDYASNPAEEIKHAQRQNFIAHIQASQESGLPISIHARDADTEIAEILETWYAKQPFPIIMHCFASSKELADRCLAINSYFSASGIITFKNARQIPEIFNNIPNNKLLIETDAPFLAPVPNRGKPNRPAYVKYVCEKLAAIKGVSYQEMASITTTNFFNLFRQHVEKYLQITNEQL
jgi:TatD DNase family protein